MSGSNRQYGLQDCEKCGKPYEQNDPNCNVSGGCPHMRKSHTMNNERPDCQHNRQNCHWPDCACPKQEPQHLPCPDCLAPAKWEQMWECGSFQNPGQERVRSSFCEWVDAQYRRGFEQGVGFSYEVAEVLREYADANESFAAHNFRDDEGRARQARQQKAWEAVRPTLARYDEVMEALNE